MLQLEVTVPIACFRKGFAREYWESEELPPPSTCYGFLLSWLESETADIGARVCPALLIPAERSTVLRTLWRVKDRGTLPGIGTNSRPDYQDFLTDVHLAIWLDSTEELNKPDTLEDRVIQALDHPERNQPLRWVVAWREHSSGRRVGGSRQGNA